MRLLRQFFELLHIGFQGIGEIVEIKWKQIRVGEAHYCRAAGLGQSAAIDEIRIAKMGVPVKIIIDGVVDSSAIFSAETDIQRCHTIMLEECSVIRARP